VAYVYLRRNRKKNVLVITQAGDAIPAVSSLAERAFRTSGDALDALNAAGVIHEAPSVDLPVSSTVPCRAAGRRQ